MLGSRYHAHPRAHHNAGQAKRREGLEVAIELLSPAQAVHIRGVLSTLAMSAIFDGPRLIDVLLRPYCATLVREVFFGHCGLQSMRRRREREVCRKGTKVISKI